MTDKNKITEDFSEKESAEIIRMTGEYWKQIVAVQMHFNDLCIRTRWLFLTILISIFAVSFSVLRDETAKITFVIYCIGKINLHFSVLIMILSLGIWFLFRRLDREYYYKLLISSVSYGEKFEADNLHLKKVFPSGVGLTAYISSDVSRETAKSKVRMFYHSTFIVISLTLILMAIYTNIWVRPGL